MPNFYSEKFLFALLNSGWSYRCNGNIVTVDEKFSTVSDLAAKKDKIIAVGSIDDGLKNIYSIEHSRHRSFDNFIINLFSGLIACFFFPKKPATKYDLVETDQLALF